jgi:hypothetical protein
MVVCACNPSARRLRWEDLEFKASLGLHSEFEASLGYIAKPSLKQQQ